MDFFYNFIRPTRKINQKLFVFLILGFIILFPNRISAQADFPAITCWESTVINIKSRLPVSCTPSNLTITTPSLLGAGVSVATDSTIVYYHNTIGRDTIGFTVVCNGTTIENTLYIHVVKCPDNVDIVDCVTDPDDFPWVIKEAWVSKQTDVCTYQTPMVGDLNGDGIPEIVIPKLLSTGAGSGSQPQFRTFQGIYVFWGHDRDNPTLIPTVVGSFQSQEIAMAKATINGKNSPLS